MTREAASASEMWQWLCALAGFRTPAGAISDAVVSVRSSEGMPAQVSPGEHADAALVSRGPGAVLARRALGTAALELFERYAPLCATGRPGFVVAHLGQSLDGRIGPLSGEPEAITGPEDMTHNHRMRALFDVVLVGAGTVCYDDPQLTVRHVEGKNPVRVVLDPERRLSSKYLLFNDGLAPTLLLCRAQRCQPGERHGQAEVVGVAGECSPAAVLRELERRELRRIFIEGGGVTVSRFLAARCLHRLQLAVSPLIMGQGRPGIDLGETLRLRPSMRRFQLADDILFECCFDDE
jgi:diaminohydroxyphosphoribosylaminopyrimidine deaminase / 5-amino-6-(5-phosphoribosylamino)uracil reductase